MADPERFTDQEMRFFAKCAVDRIDRDGRGGAIDASLVEVEAMAALLVALGAFAPDHNPTPATFKSRRKPRT